MSTSAIKEELHYFIENGDDKLLKMMYAIAKEYTDDDDRHDVFSEAEIEEFDRRSADMDNGVTKIYSWEEAKKIITGK